MLSAKYVRNLRLYIFVKFVGDAFAQNILMLRGEYALSVKKVYAKYVENT